MANTHKVILTRTDSTTTVDGKEVEESKEYLVEKTPEKNLLAAEIAAEQAVKDGFLKSASEGWRASVTPLTE